MRGIRFRSFAISKIPYKVQYFPNFNKLSLTLLLQGRIRCITVQTMQLAKNVNIEIFGSYEVLELDHRCRPKHCLHI